MVGTGLVVGRPPGGHGVDVTPAHDGVDQSVAAPAGDVVVVETQRAQVVDVVGEA